MTTPPNLPPGWYPDRHDPRLLRWWDGSSWSYHVQPRPGAARVSAVGRAGASPAAWVVVGLVAAFVLLFVLGAVGLVAAFLVAGTGSTQTGSAQPSHVATAQPPGEQRTFLVTRVVDGDTIELANGEHVRLRGINTPEVGQCGFEEASAAMRRLVEGERVVLTRAGDDRDRYGRLLRYVDVGGTDAGLRLIERGLAVARYDSRDGYGAHPREAAYVRADRRSPAFTCE